MKIEKDTPSSQDTTTETDQTTQLELQTSAIDNLEALVKVLGDTEGSVSALETIGEMLDPRLSDFLQSDRFGQVSSNTNTPATLTTSSVFTISTSLYSTLTTGNSITAGSYY